jgi:DNA repair protein RadC
VAFSENPVEHDTGGSVIRQHFDTGEYSTTPLTKQMFCENAALADMDLRAENAASATAPLRELRVVYRPVSGAPAVRRRVVTSPRVAAEIIRPLLEHEPVEVFCALLLDAKHKPLAWHVVSRGTLDATLVHPREVIKAACLGNAAAVILAHNHPSGDPAPSRQDVLLTRRLGDALALVGIQMLDALVIGAAGRWTSILRCGQPALF